MNLLKVLTIVLILCLACVGLVLLICGQQPVYNTYHIDPINGECYTDGYKGRPSPCDYEILKQAISKK